MVIKEGVTLASKYLVMYARPNELSFNRLGLSVSKKVGKAVIRNRIKRLLREAMRKPLQGVTLNYDFILVARRSSVEGELNDFIRDIKRFLPRLFYEKSSDITNKTI
ncbi:MAG: ribonuclease P protein component [Nitrospirae bacterium]|nr:ribonuclease P protein component [Nitrospirota bacterium]